MNLACSVCHGTLGPGSLRCARCDVTFPIVDGVPDLVPPTMRAMLEGGTEHPAWSRWQEAIRGLEVWRARQRKGPATASRGDGVEMDRVRALFERAKVGGRVVDVGAKDGFYASLLPPGSEYVGVDPYPRAPRARARLVRGIAEALPIADGCADAVICMAAFDYFADGARAVDEWARVLCPEGRLALLVSVVSPQVARARGGATRAERVVGAWSARRDVGVRGAMDLLRDAIVSAERAHTHYYTREDLLARVQARFTLDEVRAVPRVASEICYIAAHRSVAGRAGCQGSSGGDA